MQTPKQQVRILLVGYFDRGNLGDDAMRDALVEFIRVEFPSISVRCRQLPKWGRPGARMVLSLLREFGWADAVMLAGGSHFHDGYGLRSIRILATFLGLFLIARLRGASVAYAGIGVGPVKRPLARLLVSMLLRMASVILVRDPRSAATVRTLVRGSRPLEGVDAALLLQAPISSEGHQEGVLGVSLVPYGALYERDATLDRHVVRALAAALGRTASEAGLGRIRIFVFCGHGTDSDTSVSRALAREVQSYLPAEVLDCGKPVEVLAELTKLKGFVATRYHAAVLAYIARVPTLVVAYHEKCIEFASQIGLPRCAVLSIGDIACESSIKGSVRLLLDRPARFAPSVDPPIMRERARDALGRFIASVISSSGNRA